MVYPHFVEPTKWDEYGSNLKKNMEQIQNEGGKVLDVKEQCILAPGEPGIEGLFYSATILYSK